MKIEDAFGKNFGRLTVVGVARRPHKKTSFVCLCECGVTKEIYYNHVTNGATRSCGCLRKEENRLRAVTHGGTYSAEYIAWSGMKRRCYNKNDKSWERYGGRGIGICTEWRESFENFFADMGVRPSRLHSIDRIDNDSEYSAANCRWADKKTQRLNQRPRKNSTGYPGVTIFKTKKDTPFNAYYYGVVNGAPKRYHVGNFSTPEEAFNARNFAKEAYEKKLLIISAAD